MSENLKVKKENALKAYEAADASGKKLLVDLFPGQIVPVSIHERIKNNETITFDDILTDQKTTAEEFAVRIANDTDDEAAFKRGKLISKALNITPLKDGEWWYVLIFNKAGFGFSGVGRAWTCSASYVGSRLLGFRDRNIAEYVGKTLGEIYKPLA